MSNSKFKLLRSKFESKSGESSSGFDRATKPKTIDTQLDNTVSNVTHNILLLGESGVGKSTFINAVANYLTFANIEAAKSGNIVTLVGTTFLYVTNSGEVDNFMAREDDNETTDIGESSTQRCKSYKFRQRNGTCVRIIDTPGLCDTRGTQQTFINFEAIMKCINACGELTAICVIMKSDHTRINDYFKQCLNQLFCQLHQSVKQNVVFLFTHGIGVHYCATTATALVNKFLAQTKINIKLTKENSYCVENETFNYLIALSHNLISPILSSEQSWRTSSETSRKFLRYVFTLTPHNVRSTISINRTRQLLHKLTLSLSDVMDFIEYILKQIAERKKAVEQSSDSIQLRKLLFTPTLIIEIVKLENPKLVCVSNKCTQFYSTSKHFVKAIYNQTCCPNCGTFKHFFNHGNHVKFVSKSMLSGYYCIKCMCLDRDHRMIYHETKLIEKAENEESFKSWNKSLEQYQIKQQLIAKLESQYFNYVGERNTIIKALAVFYCYLKENSMVKCADIFKRQTLQKFQAFNGQNCLQSSSLREVLEFYKSEKQLIKSRTKAATSGATTGVTLVELERTKHMLCGLKYNGESIKKIYRILNLDYDGQEVVDESIIDIANF